MVFPIILLFFVAMTVFTQAFTMRDTAQHAAYEGARIGLLLEASAADCQKASLEFLENMSLEGSKVSVSPAVLSSNTDQITVTVSIPFGKNAWISGGFMNEKWVTTQSVTLSRYRKHD